MFKILRSLIPLGVLGGFCSLSIADAQTLPRQPPTRTQVAKALVERLRSLTDTEVLSIIKATNPDLPVTIYINYFVNTQSYTAAIKVTAPAFLNWRTFYEASCNPLFNIPPDCGLITPDSNRATKTSLDKYKDQNLKYEYTPAFVAGSAWPLHYPALITLRNPVIIIMKTDFILHGHITAIKTAGLAGDISQAFAVFMAAMIIPIRLVTLKVAIKTLAPLQL